MASNFSKIIKKRVFAVTMTVTMVIVAINAFAWGTKDVGTASLEFLRIGVGARPAACGESFVAVANDATAIFWNPAGLAQLKSQEVSGMHLEWFGGFKYDALSYVYPTAKGNFGAGFVYLHNNDIDKTSTASDGRYTRDGFFTFSDTALTAAYSNTWNKSFLYGINAKFIQEAIDGSQDYSLVTDLGMIYDYKHKIRLGSSIQNIGLKANGALPPIVIRLGIACNPFTKKLTLASDVDLPKAGRPSLNLGAEYSFKNIIAIRAGYKYKNGNTKLAKIVGLTAGMGIRIRNYMLDYAFVPYGELGNTHRVSLSLQWGGYKEVNSSELVVSSEETKDLMKEAEAVKDPGSSPVTSVETAKDRVKNSEQSRESGESGEGAAILKVDQEPKPLAAAQNIELVVKPETTAPEKIAVESEPIPVTEIELKPEKDKLPESDIKQLLQEEIAGKRELEKELEQVNRELAELYQLRSKKP